MHFNYLPQVNNRYLSHPYLAVEKITKLFLENYDEDRQFLIKDLIRCFDSADFNLLRRFKNIFFKDINSVNGKKSDIVKYLTNFILNSNINENKLKKMRSFFLFKKSRNIIPEFKRNYDGILGFNLNHDHFKTAFDWIYNNYNRPLEKKIALFTTCSSVKPYYTSPTFKRVFNFLKLNLKNFKKIHWLVISNSCAPIPEELHTSFPFYAYETNLRKCNKKEKEEFLKITVDRLLKYHSKFKYDYYIGLIRPNSLQKRVLEIFSEKANIKIKFFPSLKIKQKIEQLGSGYWCRMGLWHNFTLNELKEYLVRIL
ncbi:MAG: DUF5591 domain-containing protein [Candidatus Helarchaeota archaeon]